MTQPDNRVDVPIELTDEEWYTLMRMAHDRDITLNQLVEEILAAEINRIEKEQEHDPA
jgi:predicted DNA-binding ribbon-helix-helix protein